MRDRGLAGKAAAGVLVSFLLSSCAPRPIAPPEVLDSGRIEARYRSSLAARASRGAGAEAELVIRVRLRDRADPPAAQARLLLAGPEAFRLRIESAFGTALDLAARGDTLSAYVPSERLSVEIETASETLGVRAPGALGFRLWSAGWDPPPSAWQNAERRDSLLALRWIEEGDSLEMLIGDAGLPRALEVAHDGGTVLRVEYRAWSISSGVSWPSSIEIADREGRARATCRIQRVQFRAPPARDRLVIRAPSDAEHIGWSELRARLERLGTP